MQLSSDVAQAVCKIESNCAQVPTHHDCETKLVTQEAAEPVNTWHSRQLHFCTMNLYTTSSWAPADCVKQMMWSAKGVDTNLSSPCSDCSIVEEAEAHGCVALSMVPRGAHDGHPCCSLLPMEHPPQCTQTQREFQSVGLTHMHRDNFGTKDVTDAGMLEQMAVFAALHGETQMLRLS